MKPFDGSVTGLLAGSALVTAIAFCGAGKARGEAVFSCGGKVEAEAWEVWDSEAKEILSERFLRERLVKKGDTYALYDFQVYVHNLAAMARRCGRMDRLSEIASMIEVAYRKMESVPDGSGTRWVCRGGDVCNEKNHLINTEVMLTSVQFLGLATSVANALAVSNAPLDARDRAFVNTTARIAVEHLLRWSMEFSETTIIATKSSAAEVRKGSSTLLFTDKPLWQIGIFSELTGILQAAEGGKTQAAALERTKLSRKRKMSAPAPATAKVARKGQISDGGALQLSAAENAKLSERLRELLVFFNSRVTLEPANKERVGAGYQADLDRGFWRLYKDNNYAGYEGNQKPIKCTSTDEGKKVVVVIPPPADAGKRKDIGWDISHARRLVHVLDSLDRNRRNLKMFGVGPEQMPPEGLPKAFSNTMVGLVWNGNRENPLFTNYLSGANGWYRVAYDNGTGQCREGTPPFGLSNSFPTGGYITWATFNPTIGDLGRRLYQLINSRKPGEAKFVAQYYKQFSASAPPQSVALSKIMFFPSLVGVQIK